MIRGRAVVWGSLSLGVLLTAMAVFFWPASEKALPDGDERDAACADYELRDRACDEPLDWRSESRCATLLTPEFDTDAGPKRFRLPVVILETASADRRDDPIIYLTGGPGAPAGLDRERLRTWRDWQSYTHSHRDLILMDRRGVGQSEPALDCEAYDRFSLKAIGRDLSPGEEGRESDRILRRCFQQLRADGRFRPDQFGTRVSARDLAALMERLDYDQYNLVGVSYGTRLALATASLPEIKKADRVRSLTLDSLYPPDQGGLMGWPAQVTAGVERFLDWCETRPDCAGDTKDLDAQLDRALARLSEAPETLSVTLRQSGESHRVVVNDYRLVTAVFGAIYDRYRWPDIAEALAGAVEGDRERMAPLIDTYINRALDPSFSHLTFMAVDCLDHPIGAREAYEAQLDAHSRFRDYMDRWDHHVCHWLGSADEPLGELKPLPIPTLILAGELDPVTPADWARRAARQWPEAQRYIAEGIGHSVLWSDTCVEAGLGRFLDDPERDWSPDCEAAGEE